MNKLITTAIAVVVAITLIATTATIIDNSSDFEDNELYVFVLSGQSNAQYYQENVTVANDLPSIPYGSAFYYGSALQPAEYSDNWENEYSAYDIYPVNNPSGEYTIGSIEPGFASKFVRDTGHKCLIINVARGGASIFDFLPGQYLYTYAHTLIDDAFSKIDPEYTVVKSSLIWIQGEANRMMSAGEYESKFAIVQEDYADMGFDTVLMSKVRAQWSPNISNAQIVLGHSKSVHLTQVADTFSLSKGTMSDDGLHYSQKGRNILGEQLAEISFVKSAPKESLDLLPLIPLLLIVGVIAAIGTIAVSRRN